MKLRNKKTGEILDFNRITDTQFGYKILLQATEYYNKPIYIYNSLAELNAVWEDAPEEDEDVPEEPKEYWFINSGGETVSYYEEDEEPEDTNAYKEIGNYFETKEEAEKAVEKLRAWKVLKDMDFKIVGIRYRDNKNYIEWSISQKVRDDHFAAKAFNDTLHLLFGGEDE